MRAVKFEGSAYTQFCEWVVVNMKTFKKIANLINEVRRDPYHGTGKPEPLKHNYSGYWSRRIDDKNRLVYRVSNSDEIVIASCKGHYS